MRWSNFLSLFLPFDDEKAPKENEERRREQYILLLNAQNESKELRRIHRAKTEPETRSQDSEKKREREGERKSERRNKSSWEVEPRYKTFSNHSNCSDSPSRRKKPTNHGYATQKQPYIEIFAKRSPTSRPRPWQSSSYVLRSPTLPFCFSFFNLQIPYVKDT